MYAKSIRPSVKHEVQKERSARSKPRASGALKFASKAHDEADFLQCIHSTKILTFLLRLIKPKLQASQQSYFDQ